MGRVRRTPRLTGGAGTTAMAPGGDSTTPRMLFAPEGVQTFLQKLQQELRKPAVEAITIDMAQVSYLSPEALNVLVGAGMQAGAAGKLLFIDNVRTPVYKTLHLAKLAACLRRVHHG